MIRTLRRMVSVTPPSLPPIASVAVDFESAALRRQRRREERRERTAAALGDLRPPSPPQDVAAVEAQAREKVRGWGFLHPPPTLSWKDFAEELSRYSLRYFIERTGAMGGRGGVTGMEIFENGTDGSPPRSLIRGRSDPAGSCVADAFDVVVSFYAETRPGPHPKGTIALQGEFIRTRVVHALPISSKHGEGGNVKGEGRGFGGLANADKPIVLEKGPGRPSAPHAARVTLLRCGHGGEEIPLTREISVQAMTFLHLCALPPFLRARDTGGLKNGELVPEREISMYRFAYAFLRKEAGMEPLDAPGLDLCLGM